MTHRPCPVCNNIEFKKILEMDKWSVYECTRCTLGITDPFPNNDDRPGLYDDAYFQPNAEIFDIRSSRFKKKIAQESHRVRFLKTSAKKGRLLDVGCGSGFFLYAAKKGGYSVEGLDISDSNKYLIETKLDIPVTVSPVEEMDYPENRFDAITMWHCLEHTPEPRRIIEKCLPWLKPEGALVIEVPNHNCVDAKINHDTWPNWALPFHLYHFTRDSLSRLAETCNLNVVATRTYLSEFIKETLDKKTIFRPFSRIIARQFDGGGIAVACKKRHSDKGIP